MDNVKTLYIRVAELHKVIEKHRYEKDIATQNSLNHSLAEEFDRATDEANTALRCMHEIVAMEQKVVEAQQQIMVDERQIVKLQQQEVTLREENCHHTTHINKDTKQRLDEITRQLKVLHG